MKSETYCVTAFYCMAEPVCEFVCDSFLPMTYTWVGELSGGGMGCGHLGSTSHQVLG